MRAREGRKEAADSLATARRTCGHQAVGVAAAQLQRALKRGAQASAAVVSHGASGVWRACAALKKRAAGCGREGAQPQPRDLHGPVTDRQSQSARCYTFSFFFNFPFTAAVARGIASAAIQSALRNTLLPPPAAQLLHSPDATTGACPTPATARCRRRPSAAPRCPRARSSRFRDRVRVICAALHSRRPASRHLL